MTSTLLLRRMGISLKGSLLRGHSRKQNFHFMSSPCINHSTYKLIRRSGSTDAPVDFEVKELQDDVPGG